MRRSCLSFTKISPHTQTKTPPPSREAKGKAQTAEKRRNQHTCMLQFPMLLTDQFQVPPDPQRVKHVPRDTAAVAQAMIEEVTDDNGPSPRTQRLAQATHMPTAFTAARIPPADATVIADPYEAYLREHKHGEPDMVVAVELNVLRAILPVIDGQDRVEAILDPGCQIVAMSEEVSNALALPYDPSVHLNMVSTNGGIDQSLGLARNVPFLVGDIVLYLQVHVLRAPAYDILLGRPFDVLTQSVVRNFSDENQTVTILDPNTGCKATVPTIQRGSFRFAEWCTCKCPVHSADF